jgi:hypothetical protein
MSVDRDLLGESSDDDNSSIASFGSLDVDLPDENPTSHAAAAASSSSKAMKTSGPVMHTKPVGECTHAYAIAHTRIRTSAHEYGEWTG